MHSVFRGISFRKAFEYCTFRRLGHGRAEAVHVVSSIAVIAKQELVLQQKYTNSSDLHLQLATQTMLMELNKTSSLTAPLKSISPEFNHIPPQLKGNT